MEFSSGKQTDVQGPCWDPPVDLDSKYLNDDQISQVKQMLREECASFAKEDSGIGCAPELELDIQLSNPEPVKKNTPQFHLRCTTR